MGEGAIDLLTDNSEWTTRVNIEQSEQLIQELFEIVTTLLRLMARKLE